MREEISLTVIVACDLDNRKSDPYMRVYGWYRHRTQAGANPVPIFIWLLSSVGRASGC